eukprot:scpid84893/ scgid31382/ 
MIKLRLSLESCVKGSAELEKEVVEALKQVVALLTWQLFCFDNVKSNHAELKFLTGISIHTGNSLRKILDVSKSNSASANSVKTEVKGRMRVADGGRHSTLSYEDQLHLTLMR